MNTYSTVIPIDDQKALNVNCLDRSVVMVQSMNGGTCTRDPDIYQTYGESDFRSWFFKIAHDTAVIKALLFLTTKCNLSCAYCFQDGYTKEPFLDLSIETADKIILWLIEFALMNQSNTVHLYLYGGEPCLNPKLVNYLATTGKINMEKAGLNVTGHMFTNGVILQDTVFSAIKSGFIRYLQITLDGMSKVHNLRRPFKGGEGTFDNIIENLKRIINETNAEITILSNFDKENIDSIKELYHLLDKSGLAEKLFFTCNPVFKTPYNCSHCSSFSLTDDESYNAWSNLIVETHNSGFHCNPLPIFDKGPCSYWRKSHFIFDTEGDIYKCIGMPGMKQYSIGNVSSLPPAVIHDLPSHRISGMVWENDMCRECPYLPLCLGGCRFHALIEYKDVKKPYCHKDLIEKCEFQTIKRLYGNIQA